MIYILNIYQYCFFFYKLLYKNLYVSLINTMETAKIQNLTQTLNRFEIQCITGFFNEDFNMDINLCECSEEYEIIKELKILMKKTVEHDFKGILESEYSCLKPFEETWKIISPVFYERDGEVKSNFQYLFHPLDKDCPYIKQLILLLVGVAALQEFVKINLFKPSISFRNNYSICQKLLPETHFFEHCIIDALGRDGEVISSNVVQPKLLYFSLMLLFGNNFDKCITHKWWLMRCMIMHQKILPDIIISLYQSLTSLLQRQSQMNFLHNKEESLAQFMFYIECAQMYMYYHELNIARRFLVSAQNVLGLGLQFKIAFSKLSELPNEGFVKVKRHDKRYNSSCVKNNLFPSNFFQENQLKSYFHLSDNDDSEVEELLPEEQILLLAYCSLLKNWKRELITQEEDQIILYYLISQPQIWAIQMKALILMCQNAKQCLLHKDEVSHQIKELICSIEQNYSYFSLWSNFIYCVSLPTYWEFQELYADNLVTVNKERALLVYKRFHMWDKAIANFGNRLDFINRNTKILEEEIAIKPNPLLWCYLGDLTNDMEKYQVAWALSRGTNVRSRRCLGYYYFAKQQYIESLNYFKKAIEMNYLQPKMLLCMGNIALLCKNFELAIKVYNQFLKLDNKNFVAWNNLTTAYIKRNRIREASRSLLESQQLGTESKTSNNYLLVCVRSGAFNDAINCMSHLFLQSSPSITKLHLEVLEILLNAVVNDIPDIHNIPSYILEKRLLSLFKQLFHTTANPYLWRLYSAFLWKEADITNPTLTLVKSFELLKKCIFFCICDVDVKIKKHVRLALQCVKEMLVRVDICVENTAFQRSRIIKEKVRVIVESILFATLDEMENDPYYFCAYKGDEKFIENIIQKKNQLNNLFNSRNFYSLANRY